ncbi:MAG: chlorite dismutase family protein [Chloroflexi bacterium]|nr:chlorite dismutase family protein [Chloroflexota bacterium]
MTTPHDNGMHEIPKGQFVQYAFYKVDSAWRLLPAETRAAHKRDLAEVVERIDRRVSVRGYTLTGLRADADFLLWTVAPSPREIQELGTALYASAMGPYLRQTFAYLAMTKRSIYVRGHSHAGQDGIRLRLSPAGATYLFVYPFVKTRAWYQLSMEDRQRAMNEHIRIGHKYPSVKLNTTYSFGLDDQEFVVAFETDEPGDFVDLVMELRHTEASLYTLRDTPIFTCIAMSLPDTLDSLDGVASTAAVGV